MCYTFFDLQQGSIVKSDIIVATIQKSIPYILEDLCR